MNKHLALKKCLIYLRQQMFSQVSRIHFLELASSICFAELLTIYVFTTIIKKLINSIYTLFQNFDFTFHNPVKI